MKTKILKILKLIWKILKFLFTVGETYISDESANDVVDKPQVLTLKKKKGDKI